MDEGKEVVTDLMRTTGIDFSSAEQEIQEFFDDYLYHGNYDGTLDIKPRALYFVQEDEYDNNETNADGDEWPDIDEMVVYSAGHYIFFV